MQFALPRLNHHKETRMGTNKTWAIIGGGNGGQSLAGHLAIMGYRVRLYDIFPETVATLNALKCVTLRGRVTGCGPLEFASTDIGEVLKGADYVMVTVPATAHPLLATQCAPHLRDGQHVYVHPGASLGALDFYTTIKREGCTADVTISETNSLIYSCRAEKPGFTVIHGIKQDLILGTIPANRTDEALAPLQACFPQVRGGKNIFESTLANGNAMLHPGPSLLNASLIESEHSWRYYVDGITPSIGAFVEKLDAERMAVAKALNAPAISLLEWFKIAYGVDAKTISEASRTNPAYQDIAGQKVIRTRYIMEDIPKSLVPLLELARVTGVDAPCMASVAEFGLRFLGPETFDPPRTFANMGIGSFDLRRLEEYVTKGA